MSQSLLGLEGRPECGQPEGWCLYRWQSICFVCQVNLQKQLPLTAYLVEMNIYILKASCGTTTNKLMLTFFNCIFCFEINVDARVPIRSNTQQSNISFIQFSPVAMSYKTKVKYHNQDIDMDTVKIPHNSITKGSLILPFYSHTCFPVASPSSLTLDNDYSVFHVYNFKNII